MMMAAFGKAITLQPKKVKKYWGNCTGQNTAHEKTDRLVRNLASRFCWMSGSPRFQDYYYNADKIYFFEKKPDKLNEYNS